MTIGAWMVAGGYSGCWLVDLGVSVDVGVGVGVGDDGG